MVRIRLRRIGGKNQASFRIVAADKESPRNGRFIEILGFYNPRTEPATISLKEDRIYHWISKGAQPSDSATQIFNLAGLTGRYERFKTGEKVETLVAEADAAAKSRTTNLRTNRAAPAAGSSRRKAAAREAAAAAAAAAPPTAAPARAAEAPAAEPVAEETPVSEEAPATEAPAEAAGEAPAAE
jgi:small subunit ribosomal protein S16